MKHQELRARAKVPDLSRAFPVSLWIHLKRAKEKFGGMLLHDIRSSAVSDWLTEEAASRNQERLPAD